MKGAFAAKAVAVTLGSLFCLLLLEAGVRVAGHVFRSLQEHSNQAAIRRKGAYRILCVGESTTALFGKDSYPSQLEDVLNERAVGVRFSVINKGIPSGNSTVILAELPENLERYRPDMVIAMIGINDGGSNVAFKKPAGIGASLLRAFRTFKLAENDYGRIFSDTCYGDFGHCTKKGCRLLAENIADVVLAKRFPAPISPGGRGRSVHPQQGLKNYYNSGVFTQGFARRLGP